MTIVLQPLQLFEITGVAGFSIFIIFIAVRLWSYAYFKSKWEQFERKMDIMKKLL